MIGNWQDRAANKYNFERCNPDSEVQEHLFGNFEIRLKYLFTVPQL